MATYTTVTRSNFFTALWNNVFETLNDNLTDPSSRGTKWIFASFPYKLINDKSAYPFVVIEPVNITSSEDITLTKELTTVNISITIYAVDPNHLDSIGSDILNQMFSADGTFHTYNMKVIDVNNSTYTHAVKSKSFRVHARTITFSFQVGIWQ